MKTTIQFLLLLFILELSVSCGKRINCADIPINPVFVGFDSSDIDSVIIRQYKAESNYQILIDTFLATPLNSQYNYDFFSKDSTIINVDIPNQNHCIKVGFDWEIIIVANNQETFISKIVSEKTTTHSFEGECYNRVFSLSVNSQQINVTHFPSYLIYINK